MQFYYGENNIIRALDEAEFWKHQEAEHTVVVQLVTPGLEDEYVTALKEFGLGFGDAYGDAIQYIQTMNRSNGQLNEELKRGMMECIRRCIRQSKNFVNFLEYIMQNSMAVKKNNSSQVVIYHIIRESKYFIGIDQLMIEN